LHDITSPIAFCLIAEVCYVHWRLLLFHPIRFLLLFLYVSLVSYDATGQELILCRSAKTLPQKKVLIWESSFFADFKHKYDYDIKKYSELEGDNYKFTSYTMLGYGILDNLELLVQFPVYYRYKESAMDGERQHLTGFGDMSLQTRVMVYRGKGKLPSANVGFIVRFPSGDDKSTPPIGDGTTDLGFSSVVSWKINFFVGHFKLGYIFNGRNGSGANIGDSFLYMLKGDFILFRGNSPAMKELALMVGVNANLKFKDTDFDGEHLANSYQYRPLNIVAMLRWTPVKGFFMRPRVIIPIEPLSSGGKLYVIQYILDLKYSF
jgi:hypothetical protein